MNMVKAAKSAPKGQKVSAMQKVFDRHAAASSEGSLPKKEESQKGGKDKSKGSEGKEHDKGKGKKTQQKTGREGTKKGRGKAICVCHCVNLIMYWL